MKKSIRKIINFFKSNEKEEILKKIKETKECNFQLLSKKLKNDKSFILEVIENIEIKTKKIGNNLCILNDPYILKYVSQKLRTDEEVAFKAIKKYYGNFKYISPELKENKRFILKIIQEIDTKSYFNEMPEAYFLNYLSEEIRDDKEIVLAAVKKNSLNLEYASERVKNIIGIMLASVKTDSSITI